MIIDQTTLAEDGCCRSWETKTFSSSGCSTWIV